MAFCIKVIHLGSVQSRAHKLTNSSCKRSAHFINSQSFLATTQIYYYSLEKMGKEYKFGLVFQLERCLYSVSFSAQCYPYLLKINPPITPAGIPIPRSNGMTFFQKDIVSFNESAVYLRSKAWLAGVFTSGFVFCYFWRIR